MQTIMHNGIHYVPATELAKANDKLADRDNRIDELETATQQLICDIKNNNCHMIDCSISTPRHGNDVLCLIDQYGNSDMTHYDIGRYDKDYGFHNSSSSMHSSSILQYVTFWCELPKRGVIVDTEV